MENIRVTDFTKNGECSNCGACCTNLLPLSNDEIKRIKKFVKQNGIKEQRHNAARGVDMTCPFRNEASRKCLIYDVRPEICRQFVCNQSKEDIYKRKLDFHKTRNTVFMRKEFFGNLEDIHYLMKMIMGCANG